ncbi:MAG: DUF3106 domain-containing protein [Aquimonas sp.]|nr:DUF3106 domain-containing protein [Aquimonas sp.]
MSAGPPTAAEAAALCAAWWRVERGPVSVPQVAASGAWLEVHAALIADRGSGAEPRLPAASPLVLLQWARLPAGMRDLLVLREVGGLPLAEFAERWSLSPDAPTRAFRAAASALEDACGPHWQRALAESFAALAAMPSAPTPSGLLRVPVPAMEATPPVRSSPAPVRARPPEPAPMPLRGRPRARSPRRRWPVLLIAAAVIGALGWALTPQLDPVQRRLQAPPAPALVIEETVPLSSPDFALWADAAEFEVLDALDLLLWRAQQAGFALAAAPQQQLPGGPLPSPAESAVLAPWAGAWAGLDPARQALLATNATRWDALDETARERFEQRRASFAALPPLQRAALRERFMAWSALPPALQAELVALWADYRRAPAEVQTRLLEEFRQLPDAVRRGLLAGKPPELAATARAAFGFVPEEAREPTLEMLRGLDEAELRLLEAMGGRLDSSGRERLREELLAAPAAERGARVRSAARGVGLGR